ncbi:MAG: hypothetical protein ACOY4N_03225 [Pseudomonadota bacterium]|uniref:Uncharacterized protein n=1 Tax=Sphingobium xenophagum TaxID=121428 RepID=A0A249MRV6_SPHXE|nr:MULTISPECIES: hypothetical protein [Sphingobium]ASY44068.1 hypothetical protein CJD35_06090 [Sphingobium xenophagum]OUC56078.1 hypothetical protein CA262_15330 [Sphingobium sp. GW456-12-10-14-TSB1]QWT15676.1 hypothetical protein GTV57_08215 [Sphingobium xenophagum]|tara:strand:- start:927 stop:1343 length:417 start_codon:yes stop_codon:yes gene_type:complete
MKDFPMMRLSMSLALIGAALIPATPVLAQPEPPPDRIFNLIVYGDDPCPKGKDDSEIVVCARRPEAERYRIPKKLREKPAVAGGPGWGSQVATMEQVQRQTLPGSCSVIGSNGFTGCAAQRLQQWFAERRMLESKGEP